MRRASSKARNRLRSKSLFVDPFLLLGSRSNLSSQTARIVRIASDAASIYFYRQHLYPLISFSLAIELFIHNGNINLILFVSRLRDIHCNLHADTRLRNAGRAFCASIKFKFASRKGLTNGCDIVAFLRLFFFCSQLNLYFLSQFL